jgi:hypothetical protein
LEKLLLVSPRSSVSAGASKTPTFQLMTNSGLDHGAVILGMTNSGLDHNSVVFPLGSTALTKKMYF